MSVLLDQGQNGELAATSNWETPNAVGSDGAAVTEMCVAAGTSSRPKAARRVAAAEVSVVDDICQ